MSSGNNNDGAGCLGFIIAIVILFLIPAMVLGDNLNLDTLFAWWVILALIIGILVWIISASEKKTDDSQVYGIQDQWSRNSVGTGSASKERDSNLELDLKNEQLNILLLNRYNSKLALKEKIRDEIQELQIEEKRLSGEIYDIEMAQQKIKNFDDKPFYMTKKRYLAKKKPELTEMRNTLMQKEKEHKIIEEKILGKQQEVKELKYNLYDESNEAFEKLKIALDTIKKSCYIKGTIDLNKSSISTSRKNDDLKYLQYEVEPYGILVEHCRFYIFPTGIWVFVDNGKLAGIFKPKAITGKLEYHEHILSDYFNRQPIYDDTKIITKDIPHTTWLHACRDGSPDLRYNYNPRQTYYTQEKYSLQCFFEIGLCGRTLKYEVSSYDNCELLENAISAYSEIHENKDIVPILIDLLDRCTSGKDIDAIKEYIARC